MSRRHVYQLGVIGNCAYMALVDRRARVAWLCWPRFDSPSVFGALVGGERAGSFSVEPAGPGGRSTQYYIENTNVLCTEFRCPDGRFRVIDFAPRFYQYERYFRPLMLMRKIERIDGQPRVVVRCRPAGDYGRVRPQRFYGSNHIRYAGLEAPLRLTTDVPLTYVADEVPFVLTSDRYLCLTWGHPLEAPLQSTAETFLRQTIAYWRTWVENCTVPAFAQDLVIRSALVLKLHQYEDTGAIVAAPTTSLPEYPGTGRNWDYRYCWLRDAYYTLSALNHIGHFDEMRKFSDYIQNLVREAGERMQPVYGIDRRRTLHERELGLPGYQRNRPVRVGNQAWEHVQNDVYGQILLSLLPLYVDRRFAAGDRLRNRRLVRRLLDWIDATMDEPDQGLWEVRNERRRHTYTYLFHWAGTAAAAQIARDLRDRGIMQTAARLHSAARRHLENAFDEHLGTYTHAAGSPWMDASLLHLITMRHVDPRSAVARKLVERVEAELMAEPGYLYRYRHPDDFGVPEVAFVVCGYWYAEALACMGEIDRAIEAFENLSACANHLGLLSEDAQPQTHAQWGNFPQTYSHVGVINAAFRIATHQDLPQFLAGPLDTRRNHDNT